jgi:hypothetical protein
MPEAFTAFFPAIPWLAKLGKRIHKSFDEASQKKKTFGRKPIFLSPEIWTWRLHFACLHPSAWFVAGSSGGLRCNFLGLDNP